MHLATAITAATRPQNVSTLLDAIENARQNFRMACALRGLSMSEAARRAGLSRNALAQFVRGRSIMSLENALKICDVLDVPLPLICRQDGVTAANIRLYKALDRMPAHALGEAFAAITAAQAPPKDPA